MSRPSAWQRRAPGALRAEWWGQPVLGGTFSGEVVALGPTALHYLRDKGGLRARQRVLIVGACGAVGTNAVQLARLAEADVTGVCSARNSALVRGLGASRVIDHTVTDLGTVTDRYDIVLDAVGVLGPKDAHRLLTPDVRLLLAVDTLPQTLAARGRVNGLAP